MEMKDTQLAERKQIGTTPQEWQMMRDQAGVMLKSGFLPPSIKTAEQCLALFLAGKELGVGFMESVRSINIIQGKPTISPQLMLALANRTGELKDQKIDADDKRAIVTITRKGRSPHTVEFGVKEATDLGLMTKDNYRKQAKTMFVWRAMAANLRVTFPDVLLGLYTPEELGADVSVNDEGEMKVEAIPNGSPHQETRVITEPQRKRLYAIWKSAGKEDSYVLNYLTNEFGVTRTADITTDIYDQICNWAADVKTNQPPSNPDEFNAEYEALIRAGVDADTIASYCDSLPFAGDLPAVAKHLKSIRETLKADKLKEAFKLYVKGK